MQDLLIEIGTEELPPKNLLALSLAFKDNLATELNQAQLTFKAIHAYATPRRLALLVMQLSTRQPDKVIERKGPSLTAALDKEGNPTQAALGFAKSCGVSFDQLNKIETQQGGYLSFSFTQPGQATENIVADFIHQALKKLPIPKPMRWNKQDIEFSRPVRWSVLKFGKQTLSAVLLGTETAGHTFGHRFHHPEAIDLPEATTYATRLKQNGFVIADFEERKTKINQLLHATLPKNAALLEDESLLNEVTGLVEWPVALLGKFEERFLEIPQEVLILVMKTHQRYFALTDNHKKLLPYFIVISNIESKKPEQVIQGNERVLRARLSDAAFFYFTDLKKPLIDHVAELKTVVFQQELGSLYDKTQRIIKLANHIVTLISADKKIVAQAALLAKADLLSNMVSEFPELQGTMGYYYSLQQGEPEGVAKAIQEHYFPRFAGDLLPHSKEACAIALADKIDTLIGIIGINQSPTGNKDPFGLRRAALGVLRIFIEKQLDIDLKDVLQYAASHYASLPNQHVLNQTLNFMLERLRSYYLDKNISVHVLQAVFACAPTCPLDIDRRINAVQAFLTFPEANALTAANKRVSNILKNQSLPLIPEHIDESLFEYEAEKNLATLLIQKQTQLKTLSCEDYTQHLQLLASLQGAIDHFFEKVMVMTEDKARQKNRLALLYQLRLAFLRVADISLLQQ